MNNDLEEKIKLIREINADDSRFIINVYDAFQKSQKNLENKEKLSSIILKENFAASNSTVIDLDKIWCKPYFYTKMRIHLEGILAQISNIDKSQILQNPSKFCKQVIFHNLSKEFPKSEDEIDIVDFIQKLQQEIKADQHFTFIANEINEETLFKEEQLQKAIDIINLDSKEAQYEKIYDEVYNYLKGDFVANNYCDFQDNKCVAQRHFTFYPINRKNGCCFTRIKTCPHLQKGGLCNVECMACRLFSCPYLTKRGITYYASEFVLLKAFLTKEQRKHFVFDFYKPKSNVLKSLV